MERKRQRSVFQSVLSMLLVVVVASCVMAMVLIGATLASGGAV